MKPHPDFIDVDLPRQVALPGFVLTPLGPSVVQEDFDNVTASTAVLKGTFGDDWPEGLTLEDNAIDMAWHEREFTCRHSFAWVVRDPDGLYLGCVYIYPDIGTRGSAEVVTWIVDRPDRAEISARLTLVLTEWFGEVVPDSVALRWTQSPAPA